MPEEKQLASEVLSTFLLNDYEKFINLHKPSEATLLHSKEEWNKYLRNSKTSTAMTEQEKMQLKIQCLKIIQALAYGLTTEQFIEEASKLYKFLTDK